MTFQQLKYVIKIVETGSISAAAKELYVSQPSLSKAVMELEDELDATLFIREKTGIRLTDEGSRFLVHARQIIEQVNLLESNFSEHAVDKVKFAVATHHYNFVVAAFTQLIKEYGRESYEFSLKEMPTSIIIKDVKYGQCELGVIFTSKFNGDVIKKILQDEGLEFELLFRAEPYVCVGRNNPLAGKEKVTFADLEDMTRISYEQKADDSFFFSEELYSANYKSKDIMIGDKATLIYMLNELEAYTISTPLLSKYQKVVGAVAIPLECEEYIDIGYIRIAGRPVSEMGQRFLELTKEFFCK